MGSQGDILVSRNPSVFNHSPATFYNSYGNCRFQNTNNVQRQRLKSPNRANSCRSTCTSSLERKPNRPCLVIRPDDSSSSSASSSDENEPQSPIRQKKKVVFADDRGFSLTQIRLMVESPSELGPLKTFSNLKITKNEPIKQENIWKIMFSQPASNYLDFRQRLEECNVSLENVIVKNSENELTGTVKVKNICFEKSVMIRSTTNNWIDHEETNCSFVDNNTSAAITIIYDTFSFKISLSNDKDNLQFCVCFKSAQGEFWDNNNGKNYTIVKNEEQNLQVNNVKKVRNIITNGVTYIGPVRSNTWPSYNAQWNNTANVGSQGSPYW